MTNDQSNVEKETRFAIEDSLRYATDQAIQKAMREVMSQRDEILKAFIAKYGCEPDEIEQVEQRGGSNGICLRWFVRKRSKEQIERDNQLGED